MQLVTIDIETTGLSHKTSSILCMGAHSNGKSVIYHDKASIQKFFNTINKLGYEQGYHNGKFDIKHLRNMGIEGCYCHHDSLVMASLFRLEDKSLKSLGKQLLGVEDWSVNRKKMEEIPAEERDKYCMKDVEVTWRLIELLKGKVEASKLGKYLNDILMPFYRLLIDVEMGGIKVDSKVLERERSLILGHLCAFERHFKEGFKEVLEPVERRLKDAEIAKIKVKTPKAIAAHKERIESTPFNLNSPIQMLELLKEIKVLPKDKEGKITTSSKALKYFSSEHPVIPEIMRYRKLQKVSQFLTSWQEKKVDSRIYGTYNVHVTETGRLSSSEPNLQQVPKESSLRSIFIADKPNVFVISDYAQIEPRIMAHFTSDPKLMGIFERDEDIYSYLAVSILGCKCPLVEVKEKYPQERQVAKALTLAIMYGMGARALSHHLTVEQGIPTTKEIARKYIAAFYRHFADVKRYQEQLGYEALTHGYIMGIFGRKLWLPKDQARHKAFNYINQNAASEICAVSQVAIQKELQGIASLRLLTHDEVCYETKPEYANKVMETLERGMVRRWKDFVRVPLKLEMFVGESWGAKHG